MLARMCCFRSTAELILLVTCVSGILSSEAQDVTVTNTAPAATAITNPPSIATNSTAASTNLSRWQATTTPQGPQTPVTAAAGPFQVKRGFRIETIASAPLVSNPLALAFDENGRLFVAEGNGPGPSPQGSITVLTADADGAYKETSRYADSLPWVSALVCYDGGLFVAAGREILFLKESRLNSGVADVRRVLFADFGNTNRLLNADTLLNSFQWGIDNRIHLGTAGVGGHVRNVAAGAETLNVAGFDLSFDPRTARLQVEPGTAQSGLTFDDYGRKYVSNFDRPLRTPIFEVRYMARNPFTPAPEPLVEVALPATPIFRLALSPAHANAAGSAAASNATVAAWLAQARGTVVYRGSAFPSNFLGNVFIADPAARVIHRAVLRENFLYPQAMRDRADAGVEFVASTSDEFRPMQIVNGPDGALYVADAGKMTAAGKVYRIAPEGFKAGPPPRLGGSNTLALVAMLGHRNGWHRDTAARLLYERQDAAAIPLLSNVVNSARMPLARLHGLHSLAGFGRFNEGQLTRLLKDPDEHVRVEAVRQLGELALRKQLSDGALTQLQGALQDRSMLVRQQLALMLGDIQKPGKANVLTELIARDIGVPWFTNAAMTSVTGDGGEVFSILAKTPRFRSTPAGHSFLIELARTVGLAGTPGQVTLVLSTLNRGALDTASSYAMLQALGEGLRRSGNSLATADPNATMSKAYAQALDQAVNGDVPPALRAQAIRLLGVSPYSFTEAGDWLFGLAVPAEAPAVQLAAIQALGGYREPRVYTDLLQRWPQFSPAARRMASTALLSRGERAGSVLVALETGRMQVNDVPPIWLNYLRTHADGSVSAAAQRLLGPVPTSRPQVLTSYQPALHLPGSAVSGRQTFIARCVSCHSLNPDGQTLGPDLNGAKAKGKDQALVDILEPDRRVAPDATTYVLQSKTGEVFLGSVQGSSDMTITLRQANGELLVWPWMNVESLQSRSWSLMPYGLEQGLTVQNMADLLAFLMSR